MFFLVGAQGVISACPSHLHPLSPSPGVEKEGKRRGHPPLSPPLARGKVLLGSAWAKRPRVPPEAEIVLIFLSLSFFSFPKQ